MTVCADKDTSLCIPEDVILFKEALIQNQEHVSGWNLNFVYNFFF